MKGRLIKKVGQNKDDVAAKLKDARELLKKTINNRWVDEVLNRVLNS